MICTQNYDCKRGVERRQVIHRYAALSSRKNFRSAPSVGGALLLFLDCDTIYCNNPQAILLKGK